MSVEAQRPVRPTATKAVRTMRLRMVSRGMPPPRERVRSLLDSHPETVRRSGSSRALRRCSPDSSNGIICL